MQNNKKFFFILLDELPYLDVPLHTIIKLTSDGYNFKMDHFQIGVECVNTNRLQPKVKQLFFPKYALTHGKYSPDRKH